MATISTHIRSQINASIQQIKSDTVKPKWWRMTSRRFWIATLLWAIQAMYFPINHLVRSERSLAIQAIDGRMPRISLFVVPYLVGFGYLGAVNHVAAAFLSKKHWQEHCIALLTVTLTGFTIWILYPARVLKRPFKPRSKNLFDYALRMIQTSDKTYGQYNSFPSSHVYYVNVGLHYLKKEYPEYKWFFNTSIVLNAMSTLFTHQHYIADVVAGFGLSYATTRLTDNVIAPKIRDYLDRITE